MRNANQILTSLVAIAQRVHNDKLNRQDILTDLASISSEEYECLSKLRVADEQELLTFAKHLDDDGMLGSSYIEVKVIEYLK